MDSKKQIPLQFEQVHLFTQEHEKESLGWLSFPAKKNKDNIHQIQ